MVATMTLLTVTEYLCHKWPCSICRNHNLFLSSFMTYHWVCNKSNMTSATCGVGTAYPSRAPEFSLVFSGVRVAWSLVFCVMFIDGCSSFFFWPLYCLTSMASDLYLQLLITRLVSSNFSYSIQTMVLVFTTWLYNPSKGYSLYC